MLERTSIAYSARYFWLDTLCIPTGSSSSIETSKKLAIDGMSVIYASASPCLVLVSELQKIPIDLDSLTLIAYINYCGWMTRAWTLQEGNLPKVLLFCLLDGLFNAEKKAKIALEVATIND